MKTFKIEIDRHLDPNHFVEQNYPGQLPEQMQIYLLIDLDTRIPTVYVETYNFQINGTPTDIWHNRRICFELPFNVDASELYEWVDEGLRDDIETIIKGSEIDWDGSNNVGVFDDDAQSIIDDWDQMGLHDSAPTVDIGGLLSVGEFFDYYVDYDEVTAQIEVAGKTYRINSKTSDKALELIADKMEAELDNVTDFVVKGSAIEHLEYMRGEC